MKNKKNHIAFIIHHLQAGGAERVVVTLANELASDYLVTIVTLSKGDSFFKINKKVNIVYANEKEALSKNIFQAIFNNWKTLKKVRTICKYNRFDLLIGFTTNSNVITSICSKTLNIPSIISERNNPIKDPPNFFWKTLRNICYKYSNLLVVQTKPSKDFFKEIIRDEKIKVILNPISKELQKIKEKEKFDEPREKTILSVGRLDENKAQDLLIKAFAGINRKDWKVVFLGDGPKKLDYQQMTKDLNIVDNVIFAGRKNNVSDYYQVADIFVFTSKSEGLPNALMEALYFGVPSISTDCPFGPSDLISHNENGLLIPVGNQDALEKSLLHLMESSDLREKISKSAKRRALQYELKNIGNTWKMEINKLIVHD